MIKLFFEGEIKHLITRLLRRVATCANWSPLVGLVAQPNTTPLHYPRSRLLVARRPLSGPLAEQDFFLLPLRPRSRPTRRRSAPPHMRPPALAAAFPRYGSYPHPFLISCCIGEVCGLPEFYSMLLENSLFSRQTPDYYIFLPSLQTPE